MNRRRVVALAGLLASCAQENPGVFPPADQLHFPVGIARVPDVASPRFLVVVNSDYDKRFNAGYLVSFDVARLFALVPASDSIAVRPDFGDAIVEGASPEMPLRIHPFGGEIAYAADASGGGRLFVASRGRSRLSLVDIDATGRLACSTDGVEPIASLDCTEAFTLETGFGDPYAVAIAPIGTSSAIVAVGHLAAGRADTRAVVGDVGVVSVDDFVARGEREASGADLGEPMSHFRSSALAAGVAGLAFIPPSATSTASSGHGSFLAVSHGDWERAATLTELAIVETSTGSPRPSLELGRRSFFGSDLRVIEARGIAVASARVEGPNAPQDSGDVMAYLSLRFTEVGDSYNAGIAVVRVGRASMEVVSFIDVGEELGRPFLLDRPEIGVRHLYVPDMRTDAIWILDVTTAVPVVVGKIFGRTERIVDGERIHSRTLAVPTFIAFAEREGRILGFVSNFGNGTLAVIDVTDPDPSKQRLVARLGRDIDPRGKSEGP